MKLPIFWSLTAGLLAWACVSNEGRCQDAGSTISPPAAKTLAESELADASVIDEATIRGHVRFLADDLLEGRGPGSRGDSLAQLYISTQFQTLGLQPAAADGGWLQPVPLIGVRTLAPEQVTFTAGDKSISLKTTEDMMSTIGSPKTEATVHDAEIVFVGYGIQAPEYEWNDFKDVDLRGKILLVMNNDPADDPELFEGRRRLYYGRWDYKYETAARQGAAGAIIIHTTPSAGYPWQVIQTSWSGEEFELRDAAGPRMQLKAWATEDASKKIASLAGKDLDELRRTQSRETFDQFLWACPCRLI